MKLNQMMIAALAAVGLAGATLTFTMRSSAQDVSVVQGPPPGGQRGAQAGPGFPGQAPPPGQQGQFRPGQGGFGGGGGGGAAITSDNAFLYVVQGGMIFKVGKNDLRVVAATPLMGPGMPMFEGQGRPGRGGDLPQRAGGGTPPPPPKD